MQSQGAESTDQWSVFVKIDCGYKRAGIPPEGETLRQFIQIVDQECPSISIYGFYVHGGHSYASKDVEDADEVLTAEIHTVNQACRLAKQVLFGKGDDGASKHESSRHQYPFQLSAGSTPTAHAANSRAAEQQKDLLSKLEGTLELHAGNYPFLDLQQVATGAVPLSEAKSSFMDNVAFSVLSTVIAEYPGRMSDGADPSALRNWSESGVAEAGDECESRSISSTFSFF